MKKWLWRSLGILFVGLAYIGIITPGIPTTIFAILAAWAFSKSSPELYNWLHNHKVFGKYLNNWEKKRVFPKKGRLAMCFVMIISSISIYFTLSTRALLIAVVCFVLILIWAFRYPGSVEEYERRVKEGEKIEGTIKNLTDYGAFVDLGGLDGLLHITDLSWKRVVHPKEVLNVGDKMEFLVLSFDQEKMRVSLGLKQLVEDPWKDIESKYHVGQIVEGEGALTTDYGCFVKLDEDIEGLVHITDLDWKNKNINPSSILSKGDSIIVKVMEIDLEERKVSLSRKHTTENPWKDFEDKHNAGDILENMNIKSVTDFGIFVELDGGIDGLIHHSEIVVGPEEIQEKYKAGDQITVSISGMDSERERISLSLVS